MTMSGFKAQNHPQQTSKRGAQDGVDDMGTPRAFFDELDRQYGFTVDVAAAPHNAKVERFYTREQNGLEQSWAGERVWCNPPYSDIRPWVEKAWEEWNVDFPHGGAELIVMLLPANRVEQRWWQDLVEPFRDNLDEFDLTVQFLSGRMRFDRPGWTPSKRGDRPPFGNCLLVWKERDR